MSQPLKPVIWVASSLEDLQRFPPEVQDVMGYALYLAQLGEKHPDAKPLRGFGGAGVLQVADDFQGDTYRAVYTVRLAGRVSCFTPFRRKRAAESGRIAVISS